MRPRSASAGLNMAEAPTVDPSLRLAALLEAIELQRETSTQALEQLMRHTQGLDAIVREEIAETLRGELAGLQAEVLAAQAALRALARAVTARHMLGSVLVGTLAAAVPLLLAATLLPGEGELRRLRAEQSSLQERLRELHQEGAAVQLRRCGSERRLCVRIEPSARPFGSDGDFRIVKGG